VLRHADLKLREEIFGYFPREKQVEVIESQDRAEVAELIAGTQRGFFAAASWVAWFIV